MGANGFNEMEKDALGEMMNISLGASATAMSTLLRATVNITTPVVRVLTRSEFEFRKLEPAVGVEIAYVEGLEGSNIMMFSRNDVRIIVSTLMGMEIPMETFEMDELNRSAICEVMNQMMGSSATAMSEFLKMPVNISTPISFEIEDEESFKEKYFPTDEPMVVIGFTLEIVGKLESEFLNIMPQSLARRLLEPFADTLQSVQEVSAPEAVPIKEPEKTEKLPLAEERGQDEPQIPPAVETAQTQTTQTQTQTAQVQTTPGMQPEQASMPPYWNGMAPNGMAAGGMAPGGYMPPYGMQPAMDPAVMQLLVQMQQSQASMMEMMRSMENKEKEKSHKSQTGVNIIRPSESPQMELSENGGEEKANQEMLMRVPLEISVEIGRTKKLVKDILEFTQGSLVVLDKMAGEQADLYVNGQCVARGDIVVVEDNFGIRITEIVACDLNQESL